eukprot:6192436-Pleurochrysis_carterae.AAC.2
MIGCSKTAGLPRARQQDRQAVRRGEEAQAQQAVRSQEGEASAGSTRTTRHVQTHTRHAQAACTGGYAHDEHASTHARPRARQRARMSSRASRA